MALRASIHCMLHALHGFIETPLTQAQALSGFQRYQSFLNLTQLFTSCLLCLSAMCGEQVLRALDMHTSFITTALPAMAQCCIGPYCVLAGLGYTMLQQLTQQSDARHLAAQGIR